MIYSYFDIQLTPSIVSSFGSYLSLVESDRLRFSCKPSQYARENNSVDGSADVNALFFGVNSVYVEKRKMVRGFEFDSSREETLYPHYHHAALAALVESGELVTVYDAISVEPLDISNGYSVRQGKIISLDWSPKGVQSIPSDLYTNPSATIEQGIKWGTIKLLFREVQLRNS